MRYNNNNTSGALYNSLNSLKMAGFISDLSDEAVPRYITAKVLISHFYQTKYAVRQNLMHSTHNSEISPGHTHTDTHTAFKRSIKIQCAVLSVQATGIRSYVNNGNR